MQKKAFTLIELLVVIAIIGLLSSIFLASLANARDEARIAKAVTFEASVYSALGDDLIVNYTFDEYDVNDTPSTITASLGFGPDATAQGTATIVEGVNGGQAIEFGGASGGYLVTPSISDLPTKEITVSFWIRNDSNEDSAVFSLIPDNDADRMVAHVPWSNGNLYWDFGDRRAPNETGRLEILEQVPLDEWNHYVLVANDNDEYMRVYRDGKLIQEDAEADSYS